MLSKFNLHFTSHFILCVLGLCGALASPAWAADTPPPDLSGVWTTPVFAGLAPGRAAEQQSLKALEALPVKGGAPSEVTTAPAPTGPAAGPGGNPFAAMRFLTETARTRMAEANKYVPRNPDPNGTQEGAGNYCQGQGMPNLVNTGGGYPLEIIQRPEQISIIYELEGVIRRIYLKDKLPASAITPSRLGYSTGTWEGDTLVVETAGFTREDQSSPHSENAKIVERYQLVTEPSGRKIVMLDSLLTDPEYYSEPQKNTLKYLPAPPPNNIRVLSYECDLWIMRLEALRAQAKTAGK